MPPGRDSTGPAESGARLARPRDLPAPAEARLADFGQRALTPTAELPMLSLWETPGDIARCGVHS